MVATAGPALVHTPPVVELVSVTEVPTQKVVVPLIGVTPVITVIGVVVVDVPHELVTV